MYEHPIELIAVLFLLSLLPLFIIVSTSFLKFAVVLSLLRTALGLQQVPPNMVIYGLAIILSIYTMAPVVVKISDAFSKNEIHLKDEHLFHEVEDLILKPYTQFLKTNTNPQEAAFFMLVGPKIWKESLPIALSKNSLCILIPAFMVTQLTEAFKVGLLINLPFLAIDLIVSNLLLAMGMMMVSPVTISMPFKLLVFILVGGWDLLIKQLLLSFQ